MLVLYSLDSNIDGHPKLSCAAMKRRALMMRPLKSMSVWNVSNNRAQAVAVPRMAEGLLVGHLTGMHVEWSLAAA